MIDIKSEETHFTERRKKKTSVLNDELIESLWEGLNNGTISPKTFVDRAAEEMKHGDKKNLIDVIEDGYNDIFFV